MSIANTAAVVLTKQEQLKNTLEAAPISEEFGTAENRKAVVRKVNLVYKAYYNRTEIASVKRVEDLASLLIDHRYTMKAKWAAVTELHFDCEVPQGTPNKGGMKKAGGKLAELKAAVKGLIPEDLQKTNAEELRKVLTAISEMANAE